MPDPSPLTPSDLLLVQAVLARSDGAFRTLYRRHTPHALQVAWRILGGNDQDAEDAVQEAWVRAVATLALWRTDGSFAAWLNGIAAHVALDMVRRNGRFADSEGDGEVLAASEPLDDRLDLESAIRALAPGYRAVLVLHDVEGFTHDEIGAALGIAASTSRVQLFKARRAVRDLLGVPSNRRS